MAGADRAGEINRRVALAAQTCRVDFALGSLRKMRESPDRVVLDSDLKGIRARRLRHGVIELRDDEATHVVLFFAPLPDVHARGADANARRWVERLQPAAPPQAPDA